MALCIHDEEDIEITNCILDLGVSCSIRVQCALTVAIMAYQRVDSWYVMRKW